MRTTAAPEPTGRWHRRLRRTAVLLAELVVGGLLGGLITLVDDRLTAWRESRP